MNVPNMLTIFRILLVPIFVFFMLINPKDSFYLTMSLIIFILASLTDAIDGKIARKYNLVTNFGKFMDPLADKILVMSALLCLLNLKLIDVVIVIVILSREFLVTSIRLIASSNGKVIAANSLGKLKTIFQILAIISCLIFKICPYNDGLFWTYQLLFILSTIITILSGIVYLWKNKSFICDIK